MSSLDQNFSDLANILMQRRQMQRQAKLDDMARQREEQAMTLQSLHIKQLQDEQAYREGLRGAMANPGGTSVTNVVPRPESAPSLQNLGVPGGQYMPPPDMEAAGADPGNVRNLRELGLMNPAPTTPYEPTTQQASPLVQAYNEGRVQTTTTPKSVSQAGADYAMKMGRPEEAAKLLTINDAFAKEQAKGDPLKYAQLKQDMEEGAKFFGVVKEYKNNPAQLKMFWPTIQSMFPKQTQGIKPEDLQMIGNAILMPFEYQGQIVPNRGVYHDDKGDTHIVDLTPKESKGFDTIDLGDRVKVVPRDGGEPRYEKKSLTPAQAIKIQMGNGTPGEEDEVASWGRAIQEGRANLQDVPQRGTVRSRVVKYLEKQGGVDYAGNRAENSAYSSSLTQQQKQLGSMGSFVKNLNEQINRVGQIGAELYTFDSRLLNVPLRAARQKIIGSPLQSKYDMYLTEIENEIGKLSTGSTASIAELSVGAQNKWAKIHDKNLSIKDMLEILKETKHAGELRLKSVKDQIEETRQSRKSRSVPSKGSKGTDPLGIL